MKQKIHILIVFCLFASTLKLQAQVALTENFQFNLLSLNPAFTGQRGYLGVNALLGNQFNGTVRPTQVSQNIILDSPVGESNHNVGFQAFNAKLANISNTGVDLTYAYRIQLENMQLSLGVNGGILLQPNFVGNSTLGNLVSPFAGIGVAVTGDQFFVSISKPQAMLNTERVVLAKKPLFAIVGASFGNPETVMLNTSLLAEVNSQNNGDIGNGMSATVKTWFGRRIGAGISYRLEGKQGFQNLQSKAVWSLEYQYSTSMRFGVSYDKKPYNFLVSNASNYLTRTGVLQLMLKFEPPKQNQEAPRFLYY